MSLVSKLRSAMAEVYRDRETGELINPKGSDVTRNGTDSFIHDTRLYDEPINKDIDIDIEVEYSYYVNARYPEVNEYIFESATLSSSFTFGGKKYNKGDKFDPPLLYSMEIDSKYPKTKGAFDFNDTLPTDKNKAIYAKKCEEYFQYLVEQYCEEQEGKDDRDYEPWDD